MMTQISLLGAHVLSSELNTLESGNAVTTLRVSARTARKQKGDEQYAPSEIIELSCWGAEFAARCADAFPKGSKISATGRVHSVSTFMRKDGSPGATINVVVDQVAWPARERTDAIAPTTRTPEEPENIKTMSYDF